MICTTCKKEGERARPRRNQCVDCYNSYQRAYQKGKKVWLRRKEYTKIYHRIRYKDGLYYRKRGLDIPNLLPAMKPHQEHLKKEPPAGKYDHLFTEKVRNGKCYKDYLEK